MGKRQFSRSAKSGMSSSVQLAQHEGIRETARAERAASGNVALSCYLAAGALAVFYLATSLYISSHRLLWFDEVFTVHMARLPGWKTLLDALRHGVDSLPPAYYLVVNLSGRFFGKSDVAVRLPSTLAMLATLLITFDCARRLTNGLHGLIALAIAASPLAGEGFEARSYAIYVMFAALTLWVWSYDWMNRKWAAVCFGLTMFAAVSFHYYAALLLLPYALWELSRWKAGQAVPLKLIAGIVGVALAIGLLLPLITSFSRQFAAGFWSHPSLSELMEIYSHIFVGGSFVLALSIVWMVLANRKRGGGMIPPMHSAEAIGWLFLCVPLARLCCRRAENERLRGALFSGNCAANRGRRLVLFVEALSQCGRGLAGNIPADSRLGYGKTIAHSISSRLDRNSRNKRCSGRRRLPEE